MSLSPNSEVTLPTPYQQYIHKSRYARWLEEEQRRETWSETVNRYCDFFQGRFPNTFPRDEVFSSISKLEVMPSMRALMTAGKALDRDEVAGFNCAYVPIDDVVAFDEILYILMCFHPDTLVSTRNGNKRIADIQIGDQVASIDQTTGRSVWKTVTNTIKTKSAHKPKVEITLDNGSVVRCTVDHKWLTNNRGWVEAGNLTSNDDLVAPGWQIYKITNTVNGKSYIGQTSKTTQVRFKEHLYVARTQPSNWHFAKALRAYNENIWKIEVIDFAFSYEEAIEKECFWISNFNTIVSGYNSTNGGEGSLGYRWTEEQKRFASENAYERTEEHRNNQRQVLAGSQEKIIQTRQTSEYRDAQRERNIGDKNPMFGKKHSDERLAQIREQMSGSSNPFFGRKHTEETKEKIRATKARNAVTEGATA